MKSLLCFYNVCNLILLFLQNILILFTVGEKDGHMVLMGPEDKVAEFGPKLVLFYIKLKFTTSVICNRSLQK